MSRSSLRSPGVAVVGTPRVRVCSVDGCDARHQARGWCRKHYQRWLRHGDPRRAPFRLEFPCPDCGQPVKASLWRSKNDPDGRRVQRCMKCEVARRGEARVWTAEAIIAAIQRWAALHGGEPPVSRDFHFAERPAYPSIPVVRREFGLWSEAVRAAGFEPRRPGEGRHTRRSENRRHGRNRQMVTGRGLNGSLPGTVKHFGGAR